MYEWSGQSESGHTAGIWSIMEDSVLVL